MYILSARWCEFNSVTNTGSQEKISLQNRQHESTAPSLTVQSPLLLILLRGHKMQPHVLPYLLPPAVFSKTWHWLCLSWWDYNHLSLLMSWGHPCVCVCGYTSARLILSSAPFQMFTNSDEAVINKKLPKELLLRSVTFQSTSIRLSAGLLLFFGKPSWHEADSTLTTIGPAPPPSLYKHQTLFYTCPFANISTKLSTRCQFLLVPHPPLLP